MYNLKEIEKRQREREKLGPKHPASFNIALLPNFAELLQGTRTILDSMAGRGRIHMLMEMDPAFDTIGIELEPEWAAIHPRTQVGNALALPYQDGDFDAICTSPPYGNRCADHHEAKDSSKRYTYKHQLGRKLHEDNGGAMHWGEAYRQFHRRAWAEAVRVLRPGGRLVLNIKDHIRSKKLKGIKKPRLQRVTRWHIKALTDLGLTLVEHRKIELPGNRNGANGDVRVEYESILLFVKPEEPKPAVREQGWHEVKLIKGIPYLYRRWREDGKLKSKYVGRAES